MAGSLQGRVALVAGATRGAGRGIARMLAEAGAKVWCTGRSVEGASSPMGRPETLQQTLAMIEAAGGAAVAVRVDHTIESEVEALIARITAEEGRLDVLVNDIWGGDSMVDWSAKFWAMDIGAARALLDQAVVSHLITARHAAPLMMKTGAGLIVEVTDSHASGFRGHLLYDLVKSSVIRLGYGMAWELAGTGVTALTISPGFLRSEAVLEHFGVSEADWLQAAAKDPDFAESETPCFVGRAIAALAADPDVAAKAGLSLFSGDLAEEYGFDDIDGRRPHFMRMIHAMLEQAMANQAPFTDHERLWASARYAHLHMEHQSEDFVRRLRAKLGYPGDGPIPIG